MKNLANNISKLKQFTQQEKKNLINSFSLLPNNIQREILELTDKNSLFLLFLCKYFFENKESSVDVTKFILDNQGDGEIR